MKSHLKIKIKSLAAEAVIIRLEEHRVLRHARYVRGKQGSEDRLESLTTEFDSLRRHRTYDVRIESRAANLAYACLRQKPYARTEPAGSSPPPIGRMAIILAKFGRMDRPTAELKAKEWLDAA